MGESGFKYIFNFSGKTDNDFQEAISRVNKGFDEIEKSGKGVADDINSKFNSLSASFDKLSSSLEVAADRMGDFKASKDIDDLGEALKKSGVALKDFEGVLNELQGAYKYIEDNGGTQKSLDEIQEKIDAISEAYKRYKQAVESASSDYLYEQADAFNNLGESEEKAAKKSETIDVIMQSLGKTAGEATKEFDGATQKILEIGKAFAKGGPKAALLKAGVIALTAAVSALVTLAVKGIKKVIENIKEEIQYQRELKNLAAEATKESAKEYTELQRLNKQLKEADKNTAEYARIKEEAIKKFSKYDSHLAQEITKVGDLSTAYKRLAASILEASIARQAQSLIEKQTDKFVEKQKDNLTKLRQQLIKEKGQEQGQETYTDIVSGIMSGDWSALNLGNVSWNARQKAYKVMRGQIDLQNKTNEISGIFGTGPKDGNVDFTANNKLYDAGKKALDAQKSLAQEQLQIEWDTQQAVINSMQEGDAKRRAQAELNYKKAKQGLEQRVDEILKFEDAEVISDWENRNFGSLAGFDKATMLPSSLPDRQAAARNKAQEELKAKQKEYYKELDDIAFETSQRMANDYGSTGQQREALIAKLEKELKQVPSAYKEAAEKKKEYELALFDYNAIKDTGNPEAERQALEKMLDAEIATLDGAKKEAAIKRKALTLAEFGAEDIEKYGTNEQRRDSLQKRLAAETAKLEGEYKERKETLDKIALAQFDYDEASNYGSTAQKRSNLEKLLNEQLKSVEPQYREKAKKLNAITLAEFDYGEVSNYGTYDQKRDALVALWDARIDAIEDDAQKAEAISKKNHELFELDKEYSGDYALIFADAQALSNNNLEKAITATTQAIENADPNDAKTLAELYERLSAAQTEMSTRSDWGFGAIGKGLTDLNAAKGLWTAYDKEKDPVKKADALSKAITETEKAQEKIKRGAAEIGNTFSEIGSMLEQFDGPLGDIGKSLSAIGSQADIMGEIVAGTITKAGAINAAINASVQLLGMVLSSIKANKQAEEDWNRTIDQSAHKLKMLELQSLDYKEGNIFGVENPYQKAIDGAIQYSKAMEALHTQIGELQAGQVQTGTKKEVDWGNVGKAAATGAGAGAVIGAVAGAGVFSWLSTGIGAAIGAITGAITGLLSTKTVPVFESLLSQYDWLFDNKTYELNPEIIADYEKLDDETKQIVDNWEEIRNKALEAEQQMKDNFAELAGDVGNQLSDSLVAAFRNGELASAIDDFHGKMTSTIEDIISKLVFSQTFGKMFNDLEKRFNESFGENGDQDIIDDLIWMEGEYQNSLDKYNASMQAAQDYLASKDYDAFSNTADRTNQSSGFAAMSQQSADELNGQFTGLQISATNIDETTRAIKEQNDAMFLRSGEVLLELMGIHTDTSFLRDSVGKLENACGAIQLGVKKIIRDGVRLN